MTEADLQCSSHGTRTHPAPAPEDCRECKLLRLLDEARAEQLRLSAELCKAVLQNDALLALLRLLDEARAEISADLTEYNRLQLRTENAERRTLGALLPLLREPGEDVVRSMAFEMYAETYLQPGDAIQWGAIAGLHKGRFLNYARTAIAALCRHVEELGRARRGEPGGR